MGSSRSGDPDKNKPEYESDDESNEAYDDDDDEDFMGLCLPFASYLICIQQSVHERAKRIPMNPTTTKTTRILSIYLMFPAVLLSTTLYFKMLATIGPRW